MLLHATSHPASAASDNDTQDAFQHQVLQTQITRLIDSASFSNIAAYVMAVVWVGLVWNKLPHVVLSVWLGAMTLLFAFRALVHYLKLYRLDQESLPVDIIRRWYLLAVLLTGAMWGITSILMFPYSQIEQVVLAFILVGVSTTGIAYANLAWVYFGYVGLVLLPLMARLFYIGSDIYNSLAAITGFFIGVMMLAAYRLYQSSNDALVLTYRNEELIENLTYARNQLEGVNSELTEEIEHVKSIEKELKRERDRAEKMSAAKGEFLANMSHEIRTPMNGVIGTLQLLEDTELDDSQREYVETAHRSADALLAILNDILDLSKIEAGKMDIEIIPFNLRQITQELVTLYALKAEQKGVILRSEVDDALPDVLRGDPTRIRQILFNLVSNALKFTDEGEIVVRLSVVSNEGDNIVVRTEVQDSGIGIPQEAQKKLFTEFTQADGSTTRKYGGTGLGLAIVRKLVSLMVGELGVDSVAGEGSRFWFVLPLEIADAKQASSQAEITQAPRQLLPLTGKVLLVEDNPVNQMVASKMLEKIHVECELANNGVEALQKLDNGRFDAVLMDCQMPELDGFEATRQFRAKEALGDEARLPVIAMTANVMEGDRERCLDAGMDDYLGKPVKLEELESVLRRWLEKERAA